MREMKDSGIEWIGEIPSEWSTNVAFQIFSQVKNKNDGNVEINLLSLSYGKIKRKSIDTVGGLLPENFEGYNIIEANDIVLRLTDLQNDHTSLRVGLSNERGIVTSAYVTLRPSDNSCPKYLYYYLHSFDICKGFYGMGAGVRQGLNWDGLKLMKILSPTFEEQQKIADYLDSECAKIDDVITKTKTTIEEYKKLKQSVITEAVTKGIRPNREMKGSGIEWIGEMPKEWDVKVAFQLFSQVKNKNEGLIEKNLLSLSYGKIKRKSIDTIGGLLPENFDGYNIIEKDDIVLRLTDLQNDHTSLRVGLSNERGIVTSAYLTLRNYSNNMPLYLYYYLHSYDIYKGFYGMGAGVRQGLNWDGVKLLKIVLPPVEEQIEITDYLEKQVNIFDTLIAKKEQIVTELESYKKSLIYEYVTGKRAVCEMTEKEDTITIFDPQATRLMQEALAYKVIKHSGDDLKGRIHLMKIIYMLDCMLGLGLGINYLRYTRGPYNPIIESIEKNLSDKGIISVNTAKNYSYTVIDDSFDSKYNELFAKHNSEIEKIIDYMKRMKSSRAEKIATLYAAWNDMVIDGVQNITDKMIIDDVMNNWTENKAKTDFSTWRHILNDMKDKKIIPHGYGKHTRPRSE